MCGLTHVSQHLRAVPKITGSEPVGTSPARTGRPNGRDAATHGTDAPIELERRSTCPWVVIVADRLSSEAMASAVALVAKYRGQVDIDPAELVADVPLPELVVALATLVAAILDRVPGADGDEVLRWAGSVAAAQGQRGP